MAFTTNPPTMALLNPNRPLRVGEPVGDFEYQILASWRGALPVGAASTADWFVAVDLDVDLDTTAGVTSGAQGLLRLRLSDGTTSNVAVIDAPTRRLVIGWMPFPNAETTVMLEAKYGLGSNRESVAVQRADAMICWAPAAALRGGPSYPPGVTPPQPSLFWNVDPFGTPVGTVWTERNLGAATLTLVNGPTVNPSTIDLAAGQHIDGPQLTQPNDTFDFTLDLTTPNPTVPGNRFFTTRAGTTTAFPGVHLRFIDAAGGVEMRFSDGTNLAISSSVPSNIGRHTYRIVQTAATVELHIDGVMVTSVNRPVPVVATVGPEFRIGVASALTVHRVFITEGA